MQVTLWCASERRVRHEGNVRLWFGKPLWLGMGVQGERGLQGWDGCLPIRGDVGPSGASGKRAFFMKGPEKPVGSGRKGAS